MATFLAALFGFLGGPFIPAAIKLVQAKFEADNNAAKIAADSLAQQAAIDAQKEALEQATLQSEEGRWGPWVRWGFALPFVLFNFKVIVIDRMLHLGATDPLSPDLLSLEMLIVSAYFGRDAIVTGVRALARRK